MDWARDGFSATMSTVFILSYSWLRRREKARKESRSGFQQPTPLSAPTPKERMRHTENSNASNGTCALANKETHCRGAGGGGKAQARKIN